jgi:hemin uptake protein HemP
MKTHDSNNSLGSQGGSGGSTRSGSERLRLTSDELFGARREILIEHGGNEYRLRITSNDKLILTK